jgi:hypothetical protein
MEQIVQESEIENVIIDICVNDYSHNKPMISK